MGAIYALFAIDFPCLLQVYAFASHQGDDEAIGKVFGGSTLEAARLVVVVGHSIYIFIESLVAIGANGLQCLVSCVGRLELALGRENLLGECGFFLVGCLFLFLVPRFSVGRLLVLGIFIPLFLVGFGRRGFGLGGGFGRVPSTPQTVPKD